VYVIDDVLCSRVEEMVTKSVLVFETVKSARISNRLYIISTW